MRVPIQAMGTELALAPKEELPERPPQVALGRLEQPCRAEEPQRLRDHPSTRRVDPAGALGRARQQFHWALLRRPAAYLQPSVVLPGRSVLVSAV